MFINVENKLGEAIGGDNLRKVQIADALNVSGNTIYNWVNGKSFPDVIQAVRLASLLGKKVDDIWQVTVGGKSDNGKGNEKNSG